MVCGVLQELAALAINLTWNGRNAELMAQKGGLQRLVDRVAEKKDPLLMKVGQGHGQAGRLCGQAGAEKGPGWGWLKGLGRIVDAAAEAFAVVGH